jgi:hypothetical protein
VARSPDWIAPRTGHDWQDEDVLRAATWLRSFIPERDFARRIDAARDHLVAVRAQWQEGLSPPLYDPADAIAWYIFQAESFAIDRTYWVPDATVRFVPFLKRLGQGIELLQSVPGAAERAARLMSSERRQPDAGLYELLVAFAYRRRGWTQVAFVPEIRGGPRTPDLHVARPGTRWAAECKRVVASTYAAREKIIGTALVQPVHALCLQRDVDAVVDIRWRIELGEVPANYLVRKVSEALDKRVPTFWSDEIAVGRVGPVLWGLARKIMAEDDVYYGSSRMFELLTGRHNPLMEYTLSAKWRQAVDRPFYAATLYRASVVSWINISPASIAAKTRHFKQILHGAEGQLPDDRPGVIHIGVESSPNPAVAAQRHLENMLEARFFKPRKSRLRWVYCNYFVPEQTTDPNETWAMTETMAPYKVGRHSTAWPLPDHFAISPDDEGLAPGVFWDPRTPGGRLGPEAN